MTEPPGSAELGDDELMDVLRGIGEQVDPVPPIVLEAARAAFATRALDAELAELLVDSELADSGVRSGADDVRVLSFASAAVSVELQVRVLPQGATLRGLVDGARGPVVLETPGGRRELAVDDEGWFAAEAVPVGVVRLRLSDPAGAAVVSSWVTL